MHCQKVEGNTAAKAHRMAATTAAPEEIPHKRPSSRARRRAMTTLSLEDTMMTSSSMSMSNTLGTNPAPMPWICTARAMLLVCKDVAPYYFRKSQAKRIRGGNYCKAQPHTKLQCFDFHKGETMQPIRSHILYGRDCKPTGCD